MRHPFSRGPALVRMFPIHNQVTFYYTSHSKLQPKPKIASSQQRFGFSHPCHKALMEHFQSGAWTDISSVVHKCKLSGALPQTFQLQVLNRALASQLEVTSHPQASFKARPSFCTPIYRFSLVTRESRLPVTCQCHSDVASTHITSPRWHRIHNKFLSRTFKSRINARPNPRVSGTVRARLR